MGIRSQLLEHLAAHGLRDHSEASRIPEVQVVLLGGNPLPIRLSVQALRPRRVLCVTTPEIAGATRKALKNWADSAEIDWDFYEIAAAGRATDVASGLETASNDPKYFLLTDEPVGLNYTGGTKAMAVGARLWWERRYNVPGPSLSHRCTYLDPRYGLVFDAAGIPPRPIREAAITFRDIAELYGVEVISGDEYAVDQFPRSPNDDLAEALGDAIFARKKPTSELFAAMPPIHDVRVDVEYGADGEAKAEVRPYGVTASPWKGPEGSKLRLDAGSAARDSNWRGAGALASWRSDHLAGFLEDPALEGKSIEQLVAGMKAPAAAKWLSGMWFEIWLRTRLEKLEEPKWDGVVANYRLIRPVGDGEPHEVDLAFRVGHQVVMVSATMSDRAALVTDKTHKVRTQAAAMGGDHCKFLIACWIEDEKKLLMVMREFDSHWAGPDRFRILGFRHFLGEAAPTHFDARTSAPVVETLDTMFEKWLEQ
jgi:hypothetical protein